MKPLTPLYVVLLLLTQDLVGQQNPDPPSDVFLQKVIAQAKQTTEDHWRKNVNAIVKSSNSLDLANKLVVEINAKIYANQALSDVAELINPSSTVLAKKSYNQLIADKVTEVFEFQEGDDKTNVTATKNRLTSIISNLTDTTGTGKGQVVKGIIRGLISSTPVLDMASKVIGGICTFFKSTKAGGGNSAYDKAISLDKIQKFKKEIQPYISFYDGALQLNRDFGEKIDSINSQAQAIPDKVKRLTESIQFEVKKLTGSQDFDVTQIQTTFPFNFEDLYFNTYNPKYYLLLQKSDSINQVLLEADLISKRTDVVLRNYLTSFYKLKEEFTNSIAPKEKQNLNLALVDQAIQTYNKNNATNFTASADPETLNYIAFNYEPDFSSNLDLSDGAVAFSGSSSGPRNKSIGLIMVIGSVFVLLCGILYTYFSLKRKIMQVAISTKSNTTNK